MDRYIIYCTEEQVRKAIDLGAPIELRSDFYNPSGRYFRLYNHPGKYFIKGYHYAKCPTIEEMIGWLEEQDIFININHISDGYSSWLKTIKTNKNISGNLGYVSSYKEAVLKGIDAALDYLKSFSEVK